MIFAYFLIWCAVNLKRNGTSKIYLFDKHWWIQLILVSIGGLILHNIK